MKTDLNIYQRLSGATLEIGTVAKNLMVETTKGKGYKAVSERDIIDAVKPIEAKWGIYSYPAHREILESETFETETQYGVKTTFFTRIKTVYRFINVDKPEEYIETITFAEGIDSQDKGSGKGMTYADKYALMKAYKISTGEDPDQVASEDTQYTKANAGYYCSECNKELTETKIGDKNFNTKQLAAYTSQKYGRVLCPDCAAKAKWEMTHVGDERNATV